MTDAYDHSPAHEVDLDQLRLIALLPAHFDELSRFRHPAPYDIYSIPDWATISQYLDDPVAELAAMRSIILDGRLIGYFHAQKRRPESIFLQWRFIPDYCEGDISDLVQDRAIELAAHEWPHADLHTDFYRANRTGIAAVERMGFVETGTGVDARGCDTVSLCRPALAKRQSQ
ncbi:MAG: hypothetical protein ACRCWS_08280 [Propionibacteriaceae bacterium]